MSSNLVLNRRPKVPAEDTAAFGAIAERFRRAGALEQAVSLCRDGLKKFPDHVSARVTLGWSLLDLGKYDEARLELEQVMRRAPDNLAAIRGLAELHDRFEHTLHLPMDGPGQWPPPPDETEAFVASVEPATGDQARFEAEETAGQIDASVSMAPPAMGLPLWTPHQAVAETPAVVAEPPVAAAVQTPTGGSGMGSMREIDPFAGSVVIQAKAVEEAVVDAPEVEVELDAPPQMTVEELGVSDDALAALLAEADSLDAVADLHVAGPALAEVQDTPIELGVSDAEPVAAMVAEEAIEAAVDLTPAAAVAAVVTELDHAELDQLPVSESAEAAIELEDPALFESVVETASVDAVVEVAVAEAYAEARVAEAEVESSIDELPTTLPVFEADRERAAEVIAFSSVRPVELSEDVESEPAVETFEPVVAIAAAAAPSRNAAVLAALERMLARVHVRRQQLMAESVA